MLLRALLLVVLAYPAWAGPVDQNVRVCGVTASYSSFGEAAPAITGSASTGIQNATFRLKGYLNVDHESAPKAEAVADFVSAISIPGVRLCVHGNLETVRHGKEALYYITPHDFIVEEPTEEYAAPSELAGPYAGTPSAGLINNTATYTGVFLARGANPAEARLYLPELLAAVKASIGSPCAGLDLAMDRQPEALGFALTRKSKTLLEGVLLFHCDDASTSSPADNLVFHLEAGRVKIRGAPANVLTIRVERPRTGRNFVIELLGELKT